MLVLGVIVAAISGIVGLSLLGTLPVWLIWNNVLVDVFPVVTSITFWQAFWISVLSSCLFKSYSYNSNSKS